MAASKSLEQEGLAKSSLLQAGPATLLLRWWLTIRPQPQQPGGCVEEVDGRRAICDEGGFQAQGLKKFHLRGGRRKSGVKTSQKLALYLSGLLPRGPAFRAALVNQVVFEEPPSPSLHHRP